MEGDYKQNPSCDFGYSASGSRRSCIEAVLARTPIPDNSRALLASNIGGFAAPAHRNWSFFLADKGFHCLLRGNLSRLGLVSKCNPARAGSSDAEHFPGTTVFGRPWYGHAAD